MPTRASAADPDSTDLEGRIYQRISGSPGEAITLAEFMRMALYDSDEGYYASGRARIGREGDFFTSVSVGECFGMLIARWIARVMGEGAVAGSSTFDLVELGAFDGTLADDILRWLPEFVDAAWWERVRYTIVEPFFPLRTRQAEKLHRHGERVRWVDGLSALHATPVHGVVLSNELLDAMPVRQFLRTERGWSERVVTGDGETGLSFVERDVDAAHVSCLPDQAAVGSVIERIDGLQDFFRRTASSLKSGRLLFFDYGFVEEEKPAGLIRKESLRAYRRHEALEEVLSLPGKADLTASVDFSDVAKAAVEAGLRYRPLNDQHRFLTEVAKPWLRGLESGGMDDESAKLLRQFQTLTHPGDMGRKFRVFEAER
ncbi:MAG: SAM-dependent methyltransferase [Verrucomicrobiota bacterium]